MYKLILVVPPVMNNIGLQVKTAFKRPNIVFNGNT